MFTGKEFTDADVVASCDFEELDKRFRSAIETHLFLSQKRMSRREKAFLLQGVWESYVWLN